MISYEDICKLWEQIEKDDDTTIRPIESYIVKGIRGTSIISIVEDIGLKAMGYFPYRVIAKANGLIDVLFNRNINFVTVQEAYAYIKEECIKHNLLLGKENYND